MLFKSLLLIALLVSCTYTADIVACGTAQADATATIVMGTSTLQDGSTTITTMAHLNTCLTELVAGTGSVALTTIEIKTGDTDLSSETTPIALTGVPNDATEVAATFTVDISNTGGSNMLTTDKVYTLFLADAVTNIADLVAISITDLIASGTTWANNAQYTTINALKAKFTGQMDAVNQAITSAAEIDAVFNHSSTTGCLPSHIEIDLSGSSATATAITACLAAAGVTGSNLRVLKINQSSQTASAALALEDAANLGSTVAAQLTTLEYNLSTNSITQLPDLTVFTNLESLVLNIANNSLDETQMTLILGALATTATYPSASLVSVEITLLSTTTANQNELENYDDLNASLDAQKTIRLLKYGLINGSAAVCDADNDKNGTANGTWTSSTGTACTGITESIEVTHDGIAGTPITVLQCSNASITLTVGNEVMNGDGQVLVPATNTYTWTYPTSTAATQITSGIVTQTTNTLEIDVATLNLDTNYTASVEVNSTGTASYDFVFQVAACKPSGVVEAVEADSDNVYEVCEAITIQLGDLQNDTTPATDKSTLGLQWALIGDAAAIALSGTSETVVIPANTLTAGTAYTATVTYSGTAVVISDLDVTFTAAACNNKTGGDDDTTDSSSVLSVTLVLALAALLF